jgi:hypothetical protein
MKFITEGGVSTTVPILIMGLFSLILVVIVSIRALQHKSSPGMLIDTILLLGCLSLSYAVFRQITGLYQSAGAIARGGEISDQLMWAGMRCSWISFIMGFVVLYISVIGWFVLRPFKKASR